MRNGLTLGASLLVTWTVAVIVRLQVPAHLGPVRQGQFAFAESVAGMFFTLIGLGIDTYLMREVAVRPQRASEVVGGIFALRALIAVALFVVMTAVLWTTGQPPEMVLTAVVFGAASLIITNNATLATVLQASTFARPVALANVAAKIVWGVGLLTALSYDAPLPLLAMALPAAELLKAAMLVSATRWQLGLRYTIDVAAVRGALPASAPFFVNAVALGVLVNVGMTILGFVQHDEREAGWFAAVQNLSVICSLLIPVIGWVIMPMLARAYARSAADGSGMLRRVLEGLVIAVAPISVLVSAGADTLMQTVFGAAFAPAATGLAILSLVFVMTYLDTTLASALAILGKGWSVTLITSGSIVINAALMLVFVPIGRQLIGTGGECAGAAASVLATEVFVLIAMVSRFEASPLDARTIRVIGKSVLAGAAVLLLDRALRPIGPTRLVIDALLYGSLIFALRIVGVADLQRAVRVVRVGISNQ